MPDPAPHTFPKSRRLHGRGVFRAVMDAGARASRGPLLGFAVANDLSHTRVGFSIGRKVGNAARRNRTRRLLREAFRLGQHEFRRDLDVVIVVRPHEPQRPADYRRLLAEVMMRLARGPAARPPSQPPQPVAPPPPP